MKISHVILSTRLWLTVVISCLFADAQAGLWVTGYYPSYKQCDDAQPADTSNSCDPNNDGVRDLMPATELDFTILTHVIHFSVIPGLDVNTGEPALDATQLNFNSRYSEQLVKAAHAAQRKALFTVGGADTGQGLHNSADPNSHLSKQVHGGFRAATASPEKITKLVELLVQLMQERHYDGIDVDWEPVCSPSKARQCTPDDSVAYSAFITQLRSKLNTLAPECTQGAVRMLPCPLLTVAIEKNLPQLIAPLSTHFDQINAMAYDMSSAWFKNNWMTWFNAPLYNRKTFVTNQSYQLLLPSVEDMMNELMAYQSPAGNISTTRLGLGIPFYGRSWFGGDNLGCQSEPCAKKQGRKGASHPRETWTPQQGTPPTYVPEQYDYVKIMTNTSGVHYDPQYFFWDYDAEASYLGIEGSGQGSQDRFLSFDDEAAVERKVLYAQAHNLGGVMIWDLPAGYLPSLANNNKTARQPLLNSIKIALANNKAPTIVAYPDAQSQWTILSLHNAVIEPQIALNAVTDAPVAVGAQAIKVIMPTVDSGISLTYPAVGNALHPARVEKVLLKVYFPTGQPVNDVLGIMLANPWGGWFPKLNLGATNLHPIANNTGWYQIEFPIKTLNPWGRLFNQIQLVSVAQGQPPLTFSMGNVTFYGR